MVDLKAIFDEWARKNQTLWKLSNFWGYEMDNVQVIGDLQTAPAAGTWLASKTIPANAQFGVVLGAYIYQSEVNKINMYWEGSGFGAKTLRLSDSAGVKHFNFIPFSDYRISPNTTIRIFNVNAGGAGSEYQAAIFLGVLY